MTHTHKEYKFQKGTCLAFEWWVRNLEAEQKDIPKLLECWRISRAIGAHQFYKLLELVGKIDPETEISLPDYDYLLWFVTSIKFNNKPEYWKDKVYKYD